MFEKSSSPRVFGLPCGERFPHALKRGLLERIDRATPDALARVEIFVNSSRMRRDLLAAFDDGETRFIPKVRLVTDLARDVAARDIPMGVSGLRRRLELAQLVGKFLDKEPDFAARSSVFDLADSLAGLLAEMHDEAVGPKDIDSIRTDDTSGHWVRARQFISIISDFFDPSQSQPPMPEARLRMVVDMLCTVWRDTPPAHPVIVAGSTGSRGTTSAFMKLVASLPQGAVVLPGFNFGMPRDVWDKIEEEQIAEHPQARFSNFAKSLGMHATDIQMWCPCPNENKARNALVSLALRPAPVTDQWMTDGPKFEGIAAACKDMTLIEAPDARSEATAIALAMRRAEEDGKTASLITPDRALARAVTSILDRWDIKPDDSAGMPLNQTPPGRLLRHCVSLLGQNVSSEDLLILLKHPLVAVGASDRADKASLRGPHLLNARSLEKYLRRNGPPFPTRDTVFAWAEQHGKESADYPFALMWARWIAQIIETFQSAKASTLQECIAHTIRRAEHLVAGPASNDASELWAQAAGREARRVVADIEANSEFSGPLTLREFGDLFRSIVGRGLVRDPSPNHANIMIWGTLEARAQGADVVILGGLTEGVWPQAPDPDPWFSRDMRRQAGLLPPEQLVGLSAHDFQQAIGAREVILTRAKRNAEAETVASRWLIRITNLLEGMSKEGANALKLMREKGAELIDMARALEKPEHNVPSAQRPSPRPPVAARPRQLSVTRIETLIRDPYQIYASRVLRLNKLDPLSQKPNAKERGIAFHEIMEAFVNEFQDESLDAAIARLMTISEKVLDRTVLWPAARRIWLGRIRKIAPRIVAREIENRKAGTPVATECKGGIHLSDLDFSLTCEADRVDVTEGGEYIIYDYKTGKPPSLKQAKSLRVQLHLEAMMLENAGFNDIAAARVYEVAYLGLDGSANQTRIPLGIGDTQRVREQFHALIKEYDRPEQGYTSRRAIQNVSFEGDFDQLARVGEWAESDTPVPEVLE